MSGIGCEAMLAQECNKKILQPWVEKTGFISPVHVIFKQLRMVLKYLP